MQPGNSPQYCSMWRRRGRCGGLTWRLHGSYRQRKAWGYLLLHLHGSVLVHVGACHARTNAGDAALTLWHGRCTCTHCSVQWSEDVIKSDRSFGRSSVRTRPPGFRTQLRVTTSLIRGGGPVSCVQLSEGGFQIVYPLGL